jgi:hypothetical protein
MTLNIIGFIAMICGVHLWLSLDWRKPAPMEVEDSGTGEEFYFHALTMGEVEEGEKTL